MSDETKRAKDLRERPRSPRVPVNFPVELEGQATDGEPFRVRAEVVRASRGGGTLRTDVQLAPGAVVRLTPPFGRAIEAEVNGVWIDEADGTQHIGIKLLEDNGWFVD
jgi:hypothetical protein